VIPSNTLAGGFVSPSADNASLNAIRRPTIWRGASPATVEALTPQGNSTLSAEVTAIRGTGGSRILVLGAQYEPAVGRTTRAPLVWEFTPGALPGTGTWTSELLRDDTGGFSPGVPTTATNPAITLFGHVMKDGSARACRWTFFGSAFGNAQLLPTLAANDASQVHATGADGVFAVGEESTPAGNKAVVWTNGSPRDLMDAVNGFRRNLIPADWKLTRATSISMSATAKNALSNTPAVWAIGGEGEHAGQAEGWVLRIERVQVSFWVCFFAHFKPEPELWYIEPIRNRPREWPPANPANS
jgi:hypothetical protein